MSSEYTRTGARRSGDDYQDIIALDVMVEMLEHPERHQWLQVEADDYGALDDVVALRVDGSYVVKQVKFAVNPEGDKLDWDYLLDQKIGRKGNPLPSLLQKWSSSLKKILSDSNLYEASLITNRQAIDQINVLLSPDGTLDFNKINDAEVRKKIIDQIGDEAKASDFFANFRFHTDMSSISVYEEGVQKRFYALGGTAQGWLSLKDTLRSWVRIRNNPEPNGAISLKHIQRAGLWNQPEQIPQDFEIPNDYIVPSSFYDSFKKEVLTGTQSSFVLSAGPGIGKSTFLSYLYNELKDEKVPVIRHHYFLSLQDRTPGRLEHDNIALSLIGEIKSEYDDALGNLSANNPSPSDLHKWVEACGEYFKSQDKRFVVIIDGLDHVWREQQSIDNLNKLFEHLLQPPDGVVVIVGTQPISDVYLPSKLRQVVSREQWYELPLLDSPATKDWLNFHHDKLDLPENDDAKENILSRLATSFHEKSLGHPLHLKYSLQSLTESNSYVNEQNIQALPGCSHEDIVTYYRQLWDSLTGEGRQILHLFAIAKFSWQTAYIADCIDPEGQNAVQIDNGISHIRHLMTSGYLGLQPYHSSLIEFIKNTDDHQTYTQGLKDKILHWLKTKAPEYLKWAFEWQMELEQGDANAIIQGIDRDWCLNSFLKNYPHKDIHRIFSLSIKATLDSNDLISLVRIGLLKSYYADAYEYRMERTEQSFYAKLHINKNTLQQYILLDNVRFLPETEVVQLASFTKEQSNTTIPMICFDELNRRLRKPRKTNVHDSRSDIEKIKPSTQAIAIAGHADDLNRVFDFISRNRDQGHNRQICDIYARQLWLCKDTETLKKFLNQKLTDAEYSKVVKYAVFLALEEGFDLNNETQNTKATSSSFAGIYRHLKKLNQISYVIDTAPDIFNLPEHTQYQYKLEIQEWFVKIFFGFLANHLSNKPSENQEYLGNIDAFPWVEVFLDLLNQAAADLSKIICEGSTIEYCWLYKQLENLRRPRWPEDRDFNDYGFAAERSLYEISFNLISMGLCDQITKGDLIEVFNSDFCYPRNWIEEYVERQKPYMTQDCSIWLIEDQFQKTYDSVEYFDDRACHFANLANISARHSYLELTRKCVYETANNLLTHGYHKDMIIFHVLDIIKACHNCGISEVLDWLNRIIPAIISIRDLTDGDETGHLLVKLAEVLSDVMPESLAKYYMWLCQKEEYYYASKVLQTFIRTADLSKRVNQAIAKTAIDTESIGILSERASNGDQNAQNLIDEIEIFLGGIESPEVEDKTEGTPTSRFHQEKDLPAPKDYSPENLQNYFKEAKAFSSYERGSLLMPWLDYWVATDKKDAAFKAIVSEEQRGGRLGLENYDRLYEIALSLYGKSHAYTWLVKAHIERGGWSRYYTGEEEAIRRWEIVKRNYPDKWLLFIKDTMKSPYGNELDFSTPERVVRLVKYCIFMGQIDLAKQIADQVIVSVLELISPISLPVPEWLSANE